MIQIPLAALLVDMERRLHDMDIPFSTFGNDIDNFFNPDARGCLPKIVLISVDRAVSEWSVAVNKIVTAGQFIRRIIIDEFHIYASQGHFRPALKLLAMSRCAKAPLVLVSGTTPPSTIEGYITEFGLRAPLVIRDCSERRNISYEFGPYFKDDQQSRWKEARDNVHNIVSEWDHQAPDSQRFFVIVRSIELGQLISADHNVPFIHTGGNDALGVPRMTIGDKSNLLEDFFRPDGPRGLVGTACMAAGLDFAEFTLGVICGTCILVTDGKQYSDRLHRGEGCEGRFVVLRDRVRPTPDADMQPIQLLRGGYEVSMKMHYDLENLPLGAVERCLRYPRSEFLDGKGYNCFQLEGAILCHLCRQAVPRYERSMNPDNIVVRTQYYPAPQRTLVTDIHQPDYIKNGTTNPISLKRKLETVFGDVFENAKRRRLTADQNLDEDAQRIRDMLRGLEGLCGYCFMRANDPLYVAPAQPHHPNSCPGLQKLQHTFDAVSIKKDTNYGSIPVCWYCHFPSGGNDMWHKAIPKMNKPSEEQLRHYHPCKDIVIPMIIAIRTIPDLYDAAKASLHLGKSWETPVAIATWLRSKPPRFQPGKTSQGLRVIEFAVAARAEW